MFTHTVYPSVNQVPSDQWERLTAADRDLTMDRRLLGAIESSMGPDYSYATIVVSDENSRAVAIACNWLFRMDLEQYAWLGRFLSVLPRGVRDRLKPGVLFCGLPLPAGQNHLRIAPDADRAGVISELNRALRKLAKEMRASIIVVKEFDGPQCEELRGLTDAGFLKCEIPPRHRLDRPFANFDDYAESLKSRYRAQINRSIKKFDAAGYRFEQVYGPQRLCEVLTDEAHQLYKAVFDRSDYKLEFLSADFLREVGRRFGADASLTCVYLGDRLAGYTLGIMGRGIYYNMISGLDYELKNQGDVYFNLFYKDMDFAWKRGATEIDLGLTSDDFKSRLGTRVEPLYLYIDAKNWLISKGLKAASPWAFPPIKVVAANDVFKDPSPATSKRGAIKV